jgi:hypothetical protein
MKSASFKSMQTSNLWKHLLTHYKQLESLLRADKFKNEPSSKTRKTPKSSPTGTLTALNKITGHFQAAAESTSSEAVFHFTLLLLVLNHNLPFSLVTSVGLAALMTCAECPFALPGKDSFMKLTVEVHQYCRALLKGMTCATHLLKVAGEYQPFMHLSCDFWSSRAGSSFSIVIMSWVELKEVSGKDWCHCLSHRANLYVQWAIGAGTKVRFSSNLT